MSHRKHNFRAFTLVEMLVVIGLVALLMAMLLPALRKVRQSAQNLECVSNLRQIGLAGSLYHQQWGGVVPLRISATIGQGPGWTRRLRDYLKTDTGASRVFLCPFDTAPQWSNASLSYSVNWGDSSMGSPYNGPWGVIARLRRANNQRALPSETPYIVDDATFPRTTMPGWQAHTQGAEWSDWSYKLWSNIDNHYLCHPDQGFNALFFDFHVESLKSKGTYNWAYRIR